MLHETSLDSQSSAATFSPDITPGFDHQDHSDYDQLRRRQQDYFAGGHTLELKSRLAKLKELQAAIRRYRKELLSALSKDYQKPMMEAYVAELGFAMSEARYACHHLKSWMKPQKVKADMMTSPARSEIWSVPRGQVLVFSPWNYPVQLALVPVIGAVAAGNTVVLKPSEYSPHSAKVLSKLLAEVFSEDHVAVCEGGVAASEALLELTWDHVFFTGSPEIGAKVAEACGRTLSPVTLELGGKSPCVVHHDAALQMAAKRIVWGKFFNAGQSCTAPDFLWVHESVKDELLGYMKQWIEKFYGSDPAQSQDYGRIISQRHCLRIADYISQGQIICGGQVDMQSCYIAPTIIDGVSFDASVMQEEIFGPVLPVMTYKDLAEVKKKQRDYSKPLAFYYFGKTTAESEKLLYETPFGGGCSNDTLVHFMNPRLPFGGVGRSGVGAYHGKHSFDTFSHHKAILKQKPRFDLPVRYPPYGLWQRWLFRFLLKA